MEWKSLVTAKRDVTALRVARVMIQSPHKKMAEVKQQLKNLHEEKKCICKRKTELWSSWEVELKNKFSYVLL